MSVKSRNIRKTATYALFLAPMVVPFLLTVVIPFLVGVFYSLTDWNGMRYSNFVGLRNYITIFTQNDYLYSLVLTLVFTIVAMIAVNLMAFILALLCTSNIRFTNFCRAALFMPNLIGGIVLGYVWQFIFNRVFTMVSPQSMLSDPNLAFLAIVMVYTWQYGGYIMMIYITGLQTIPKEVMEASYIDGAGMLRTLLKIKIPMIMNTFTICIFLTLVNSFKQFDLNFAITGGAPARIIGGRAVGATEFLALNIYNTAITRNNFALGQTKAVVFFIVLAIISLTQVWISKKSEVEQ
jgi:raffinose/stachyose/melibiose transport system permease protein